MDFKSIQSSLINNLTSMWEKVVQYAPSFITALLLVFFGYKISKFIFKLTNKGLDKLGLNQLGEKIGLADLLVSWKMSPNLSNIIARIISSFVFLLFIMSAADILNLEALTSSLNQLISYIPNIVGALVVFFLASIAGHFLKTAILRATTTMNLNIGPALSNVAYYGLLLIGLLLALEQLKIETGFLTQIIQIFVISAGVALALSLGLGTRDVSKNLISGFYLKDSLTEGKKVKIGQYTGTLIEVTPIAFTLQTEKGEKILIPNSRLLECEIIQDS